MLPRTENFHGAQPVSIPPALSFPGGARRNISAILFAVRNFSLLPVFLLVAAVSTLSPFAAAQSLPQSELAPQQIPSAQPNPPSPVPSAPIIVLDPAHGGADTGARGESGGVEKDIVLRIAQSVRAELERRGFRVLLTRNDDSNSSYDGRAAIANAYRGAIFVTLHVSSTGMPNTVRAYYNQFGAPILPVSIASDTGAKPSAPPAGGLTPWADAQRPYVDASHRLADLIQRDVAQSFPGSPAISSAAAVRALRSIEGPAVAVEISSVSGLKPDSLTAAAIPIAAAIARSIPVFRQSVPMGAK